MKTLDTPGLKKALLCACDGIIAAEPTLTEIDTIIGDGDHGTGMREGFSALKQHLAENDYQSPYDLFRACGMQLVRVMGGASGVIFGTMLIGGHEVLRDKASLNADDFIAFFEVSGASIMKRGRSARGDKTMLDGLYGAIDAMKDARKSSAEMEDILAAAVVGAKAGAEASRQMLPRTGRSKNFREEALGWPDPGAVSVSIIFEGFYQSLPESEA